MARTTLTAQDVSGPLKTSVVELTFTAGDATNKEQVVLTGNEVLLAWNTSADTAYDITITSVADDLGRTNDITQEIGFGEIWAVPRATLEGWRQTDGKLYIEVENAAVKWAVLKVAK